MSLRARLLLVLVALVAFGLVAADVATYAALRSFLLNRLDDQLASARRPVLASIRGLPGEAVLNEGRLAATIPAGTYVEVRDSAGRTVVALPVAGKGNPLPAPTVSDQTIASATNSVQPHSVTLHSTDGPSYRGQVIPIPGGAGVVIVAVPLSAMHATTSRLALIELAVTVAAVAATGLLATWLVGVGLRPLRDIETTAQEIAGGDLTRRVPNATDRSEVGRLGIALNTMLSQIESAFTERRMSEGRLRRFVADASHELRTPLTSIRGYAELFRRGAARDPESLEVAMRRIEEEAARMGVMVDDLLLLARLDQGRPLEKGPVDLALLAADAVHDAQAVEPGRPIELSAPDSLVVTGDEARLRQVIGNLLANVRTHTPAGTPVHVRVTSEVGRAVIEVADQGPGLDEEAAARVFERFYRIDKARSRDSGGAGLGLAIVAAIAHAHGGQAMVRSQPGQGATFRIELPLGHDAGVAASPWAPPPTAMPA